MIEFEYLRNEIMQRSIFAQEQYHKTNWNVLVVWGAALTLFTTLAKDGTIYKENIFCNLNIFCFFMLVTIFFISVIILYLSSRKDRDNIKEIHKMAAYQTIFYEEIPKKFLGFSIENGQKLWEFLIFHRLSQKKKKKKCMFKKIIRKQPFLLSLIAVAIEIFFSAILIVEFFGTIEYKFSFDWVMVILSLFCILFSICLLPAIVKNSISSRKEIFAMKKKYLNFFINYAIEIGYYDKNKIVEKFGEDFWTRVMVCP